MGKDRHESSSKKSKKSHKSKKSKHSKSGKKSRHRDRSPSSSSSDQDGTYWSSAPQLIFGRHHAAPWRTPQLRQVCSGVDDARLQRTRLLTCIAVQNATAQRHMLAWACCKRPSRAWRPTTHAI